MKRRKRKINQIMKNCPLAVCILCSWAMLAAANYVPGLVQRQSGALEAASAETASDDESGASGSYDALGGVLAANRIPELALEEIAHAQTVDAAEKTDEAEAAASKDEADEAETEESDEPDEEDVSEEDAQEQQKIKPEYITYEKTQTDSPWYTDPGKIPLTTEYDYAKVDDDYFDDAVFIGDSRIVGLGDYSGLDNAQFFAKTGLTVYELLDDAFVKDPESGKKVSVSYMMQHYTYGKIYLMVGINELGTGGTARFKEAYKQVLKSLRKWQPDAVIYVQSIMGVSAAKDAADAVFNNTNIRDKNYAISKLTDGIHIFYLNIHALYEDENHNLAQEYTFDDVHLYAQYYEKWVKYLKKHAVV